MESFKNNKISLVGDWNSIKSCMIKKEKINNTQVDSLQNENNRKYLPMYA